MFDIRLVVTLKNGSEHVAEPAAADIVTAERHFGKPFGQFFGGGAVEGPLYLAWETIRAAGTTVPPFETWLREVKDVATEFDDTPLVETP